MRRHRAAFALAISLSCATMGSAQTTKPVTEIATDLAFGYCPLYLAGVFTFQNNDRLKALGFGSTPESLTDARFGRVERLSLSRADVKIDLTGVPQKVCNVAVSGGDREAVLASFKKGMRFMGLNFQPVALGKARPKPLAGLETFKARLAPQQMLYVQLGRASVPTSGVFAQLFVKAE